MNVEINMRRPMVPVIIWILFFLTVAWLAVEVGMKLQERNLSTSRAFVYGGVMYRCEVVR